MPKNLKPHLSKGILQMKFMQRTRAKIDLEKEASEGKKMYSKEISEKMLNSKTNFIVEQSFVYCEGLVEGRYSFRGMNPEIERLLELEAAERAGAIKLEQKTEVSDREMAEFYERRSPLTVTLERKFQHKKQQLKRSSTQSSTDNKRKKLNPEITEKKQNTETND